MDEIIKLLANTTITPKLTKQILDLIEDNNKINDDESFINNAISKYDPSNSKYTIAKQLLSNQIKYYELAGSENNTISLDIQNLGYNAILQFIDTSIILDIFGTQPMSGPVGLIYHLQMKESDDSSNSGATRLSMEFISMAVEAISKKMQASFSVELLQDLNAMHQPSIINEVYNAANVQLISELENYLIGELLTVVETDYKFIDASVDQILTAITITANNIAKKSKRGVGNFAVISHELFARFIGHPSFTISEDGEYIRDEYLKKESNIVNGFCGSVGGVTNIIAYTNDSILTNQILVGYKGSTTSDCGAYFAPYQYLMNGGVKLNETNMQPSMSFLSRFGLKIFEDTPKYYGLISL